MTQAYYSAVIDHPVETVWSLIRDFNNYPAYIDGVTESVIEDGKGGDEVGAIRRFCYLGNWVRQSLAEHSTLTYQSLEPLPSGVHPGQVSPTGYRGTMHLLGVTEGDPNLYRVERPPLAGAARCRFLVSALSVLDSRVDQFACPSLDPAPRIAPGKLIIIELGFHLGRTT